jgi:Uri superfamily endonuclease
MQAFGAYILYIDVKRSLSLPVGSLGIVSLPAGRYAYVGSARSGIAARVARHRRLAEQKAGKVHWHIDYVLVHPQVHWAGEGVIEDGVECALSHQIAMKEGVTVPAPGFGSSDCRFGCEAHLYLLPEADRTLNLSRKLHVSKAQQTRKHR